MNEQADGTLEPDEVKAHDRRVRIRLVAAIVIPVAIIALIPSLILGKMLGDQNETLASQQTELGRQADRIEGQAANNKKALRFLCSTTGVLDGLVSSVVVQYDKNVAEGTYDRLVERGLLTQENVEAARVSRDSYLAAHTKLIAPDSPCRDVPGAAQPSGSLLP